MDHALGFQTKMALVIQLKNAKAKAEPIQELVLPDMVYVAHVSYQIEMPNLKKSRHFRNYFLIYIFSNQLRFDVELNPGKIVPTSNRQALKLGHVL